jgi:hypothetical protein
MTVTSVLETIVGVLLVFFVPGYAVTKALLPEWRIRGALAVRRLVEVVTLSFVLSVVITVLAGYLLLVAAPSGFQAYWSSPVLEAVLVGVAAVAFVVAYLRGGFARDPPTPKPPEPSGGEEGAWELLRRLDELGRQERRLQHDLRVSPPAEAPRLQAELDQVRAETAALQTQREAQYAE